jgi:hypothetical protein
MSLGDFVMSIGLKEKDFLRTILIPKEVGWCFDFVLLDGSCGTSQRRSGEKYEILNARLFLM